MCEEYQEATPSIVNNRGATQVGEFPNAAPSYPTHTFIPPMLDLLEVCHP